MQLRCVRSPDGWSHLPRAPGGPQPFPDPNGTSTGASPLLRLQGCGAGHGGAQRGLGQPWAGCPCPQASYHKPGSLPCGPAPAWSPPHVSGCQVPVWPEHTHTQRGHCREETPRICLRWVPCPGGWQGAEEQPRTSSLHHPSLVHITAFHRNFTEGETEARSWVSPGSRQNLPRPLPLSSALSPGTGISIPRPCALRGSQPCSFLTPPPAGRAPRGAPFGAVREQWGCAALPGGGCPRVVLYPGAGELRERRVGVLAAVLAAQLLQGLEAGRPAAQALLVRTKQK